VAPSSRRLATTPSAEPGKGKDGGGFWRKCDYIPKYAAILFHIFIW
jgi:hypothetical protein